MSKQINAGILLLINEVKLFVYRFLTSGAKKPKNSLDWSSWWLTGSLTIRGFNVWQVTVTLDWEGKSLHKERNVIRKERERERERERESVCVCVLHFSTGPRLGMGNRSTSTLVGWAGLTSASAGSPFLARKPIFFWYFCF